MGLQRLIRSSGAAALALVVTAAAGAIAADDAELFGATSKRRFDDVEHWSKVFDDPARAQWQRPEHIVEKLGLAPGMRVADLGAGTGYFSATLSRAVGETGTVYAVETEPALLAHLRGRAEREGTANVVPVLASFDNPRLPRGGVDVLLILDTFHHIDDRLAYFRAAAGFLAPAGRIAVIDWKKEPLPVGPELDHKLAREQVVEEMDRAGYELADESHQLPYQYFLVFRPHSRPGR